MPTGHHNQHKGKQSYCKNHGLKLLLCKNSFIVGAIELGKQNLGNDLERKKESQNYRHLHLENSLSLLRTKEHIYPI